MIVCLVLRLRRNVIAHRRLHFGQLRFASLRHAMECVQQCLVPHGHWASSLINCLKGKPPARQSLPPARIKIMKVQNRR
jgi:hypothetical protein